MNDTWPSTPGSGSDTHLSDTFDFLRTKWGEVPAGRLDRTRSQDLLKLSDSELLAFWRDCYKSSSEGEGFSVRGWYQTIYKDVFRGKKVMDVGSGFAIDTLFYAKHGAHVTFVDLVRENLEIVRRLCQLKGLEPLRNFQLCYLEDLRSLESLNTNFDFIYCCGSMLHAPLEAIRLESQALIKHLKIGGRWVELAYPKIRWEREGRLPFDRWGERTDGSAPWVEWHDLAKLRYCLRPAEFDVVLELEFHDGDFNWFDLIRRS